MASAFTAEDLTLLGYDEIKPLEVGDQAIAFVGKAKAGIVQAEHVFVYVKTDATREELISVAKRLPGRSPLYVLSSRSGPSESLLQSAFGRQSDFFKIEDLLWARVSDVFKAYANNISTSIPSEPHFIAPRGKDLQPKDRLDTYLEDYFTKGPQQNKRERLVVLKASAGVGKTTLCRHLVKEFAKKISRHRVVPVYVEAAHWGGRVNSMSGLWDIIQMSLQNYDPGSGISKALFEAALKRGLILFVLDGFDELCSSPKSSISAAEVIENLRELAEDSEARIVLTTRTPYWDAEIGADLPDTYSLDLLSFNPQQAKDYIRKFFENNDAKFEAARQIYADVTAHASSPDNSGGAREQFWTLPIAVSMICEAVKAGVSRSDWGSFSLEALLVAICDRETKRQNLSVGGGRQLAVFKELALLDANNAIASFERDDLLAAGIPESDASKFLSHPLLRALDDGRFSFSYDFLGPFLRALAIKEAISSKEVKVRASIIDAMRAEENGKGFQMDHLARLLEKEDLEALYAFLDKVPQVDHSARAFIVHLLLRQADASAEIVTDEDRRLVLLNACGASASSVIRQARFTGSFERLDLSGIEFVGCEFRDVSFKAVNFAGAKFRSCRFDGEVQFLTRSDEESFAQASLVEDCEIRSAARLSLEAVLSRQPQERSELIKDLLEAGLSKFWHNGKFKASIRKADWRKGSLGRSRSSDALLDVFKRTKLVKDAAISGVHEGGWAFNREAINDLQNFMDHRHLSGLIVAAYEDLDRTLTA